MDGEAKLFIASPSFTASYCSGYVESLIGSIKDLKDHDIKTVYKSLDGVHWIDIARDVLSHIFLHTDCTHMLQIDSDLAWSADAPRKMIEHDADVIAGVYRVKSDLVETYPVAIDGDELVGLPAGFMMIRRNVIESMSESLPKYAVSTLDYGKLHVAPLWTRDMREDGYTGEDYAFCKRVIAAGYGLEIYDNVAFKHYGTKSFDGTFTRR